MLGGGRENGENGRVRVVIGHGANGTEAAEVVLIRVVVSMPSDHVKWGVVLASREEGVVEFADDVPAGLIFLEESCWNLKVASVGQTVGANRTELWELKVALVKFTYVTSDWTVGERYSISTCHELARENK